MAGNVLVCELSYLNGTMSHVVQVCESLGVDASFSSDLRFTKLGAFFLFVCMVAQVFYFSTMLGRRAICPIIIEEPAKLVYHV